MPLVNVLKRKDMLRCTNCLDAPCEAACRELPVASLLRSIWFDNEGIAALKLPELFPCAECDGRCEDACIRPHEVPIRRLVDRLYQEVLPREEVPMPSDERRLCTDMMGFRLENPFLLSSSVVASSYDMCARAFEAGWAGAAYKTVCTLDIHEASPRFSAVKGDDGSLVGFKNIEQLSDKSPKSNMEIFRRLKNNYPEKYLLVSIMGQNEEEWRSLTEECFANGADGVELNFSCPNMMQGGLGSDIGQVPELVEQFTAAAKAGAGDKPVLVKLTPNVASMITAARAAKAGGADGIAAINTIKSITGVNIHTNVSEPAVHGQSAVGGYSGNAVKPVALRFISEIGSDSLCDGMHISAMGGIETWRDAVEFILLGAGSLQVTTAVMQYGYRIIDDLKSGLNLYLAEKGLNGIDGIIGKGLPFVSSTTDGLERDTILLPRFHPEKCIGCGRCVISCADGGHQALTFNERRKPVLDGKKCVGCHLCLLVCPEEAISPAKKRIRR